MLLNKISNLPQKIFNFLTKEARTLGKEYGFTKRQSKVTAPSFIKALIVGNLNPHFSLEQLSSLLRKEKISITKQGIHERFNEATVKWLAALSNACLNHFKAEKMSAIKGLKGFSHINIVDSSTISLPSIFNTLFKGSGGAASDAALKIQVMFDYLEGQIKALTLTDGCHNDQGFDHYFREVEKDALYLMDLGYFKLSSFQKIIDGGAFFVTRFRTKTTLFQTDHQPIDLLKTLSNAGALFSQPVLLGAKDKIPVRIVATRLPSQIAEQRRHKLKEGLRRRGMKPSKEALALQDWSIYITNTLKTQITDEDIHQTYALRWQIELFFKLSKSLMKINHFRTHKSTRLLTEIYSKFITMMLFFLLCNPVRIHLAKDISFYKSCALLLFKSALLTKAFSSLYRLKLFIADFFEDLALFAVKETKTKFLANPFPGDCF
ncbi:IS4 family transposase [Legionella sp. PATHC038]|uniref:IS4 family transposase n=1 Tax=Legionella sheltonii TaxID=2992041 RepID=UPI002242EDBC|nr:IS4 family transposase [Legionella sp. PATHC038]MCW8400839.1 IS4 family transposase [Legionella sp. PATHC038]